MNNRGIYFQAIRRIKYVRGRTHTADALRMMSDDIFNSKHGDRETARNVAFIITDGNSNINPEETIARAIEVCAFIKHSSCLYDDVF